MMPPATTPTVGEARRHEEGHGYGLVLFASVLLVVVGCFNLIYGIAAIANAHVFADFIRLGGCQGSRLKRILCCKDMHDRITPAGPPGKAAYERNHDE